jgi:glycerol-3-phosphate dehydrogenase
LADAYGVDMPICFAVKSVLEGKATPLEAVGTLMSRDSKHEHYGK